MKPHVILRQHFNRKKEGHPSYSLRALARDIRVSPALASGLLNGRKKVSPALVSRIAKVLDFDDNTTVSLKKALVLETLEAHEFYREIERDVKSSTVQEFKPLSKKKNFLLNKWQYVAVLDLVSCKNFKNDVPWVSRRLGILQSEAEEALEVLKKLGLIEWHDGNWRKKTGKIRIPAVHSQEEIRSFHRQMIEKALVQLKFKTKQEEFDRRLIAGITFAADPKKIQKAKRRLEEAVHEIMSDLMDGDCTEVYQMNYQFFPLTLSKS